MKPVAPIENWAELHAEASSPKKGTSKYFGSLSLLDNLVRISLSNCVLVCGQCIGADKLGHMFQQGWEYYDISVVQGKGDSVAEEYGHWLEGQGPATAFATNAGYFATQPSGGYGYGGFGASITGVISNADLAANSAGMQMFKDIKAGTFKDICDYIKGRNLDEEVNFNNYTSSMGAIVAGNGRK